MTYEVSAVSVLCELSATTREDIKPKKVLYDLLPVFGINFAIPCCSRYSDPKLRNFKSLAVDGYKRDHLG